jgi:ComF family protein
MSLTGKARSLLDVALTLVYPLPCRICNASIEQSGDGVACDSCWRRTRVFTDQETICWKCGALSRGNIATEKREQVRCRRCDDQAFTAARAGGVYEGALRASVLALKHEPYVCERLVALLTAVQNRAPLDRATSIIPVPLHPERQKARGFNQATVIAAALSKRIAVPVDEGSLMRVKHAERHRAGMDERGRQETVAAAFAVRNRHAIAGEHVLLIDDVFTTGATVSSCAAVLTEAGAAEVFVLTIARPAIY